MYSEEVVGTPQLPPASLTRARRVSAQLSGLPIPTRNVPTHRNSKPPTWPLRRRGGCGGSTSAHPSPSAWLSCSCSHARCSCLSLSHSLSRTHKLKHKHKSYRIHVSRTLYRILLPHTVSFTHTVSLPHTRACIHLFFFCLFLALVGVSENKALSYSPCLQYLTPC